jgi:uncharacterized protein (TIGR03437 family)
VVQGSNLSGAGVHWSGVPLSTRLDGVAIKFIPVAGGAGIDAFLLYTYNQDAVNQLAGLLPSTVIPGEYDVIVTFGGVSSEPVKATVVGRKFGVVTASGTGTGRAMVQNHISPGRVDLNRFTTGTYTGTNPVITHSPATPGQTLVAWGTGLGPIDTPDNAAPGAIDFRSLTDIRVIVGAREIAPQYAGRAPEFPGLDVVNFELPPDIETGCTVPFQVRAGGRLSNRTTIAIAPAGAESCVHRELSRDALSRLDAGGTVVTGWFVLNSHFFMESILGAGPWPAINEWAGGGFSRYTADQLAGAFGPTAEEGTCRVLALSGKWDGLLRGSGGTALDAGGQLTASGPAGDWQLIRGPNNNYYGTTHIDIEGPSQSLAGQGGNDVGAFGATLGQPSPLRMDAIPYNQIGRKVGVTLGWRGGGTGVVSIIGTNPGGRGFVCTARADRGFFTVPSSVLTQAFPNPGVGELMVIAEVPPRTEYGRFNAPLTAGGAIDYGVWLSPALYQPDIFYY